MVAAKRVYIREHVISDRDAYVEWQTDPLIGRYLTWLPRTRDEAISDLTGAIAEQSHRDRQRFFFAVVRCRDDVVIGDVGFTRSQDNSADCGWFLRRSFHGKGLATESALLMIDYAFSETSLTTLRASCHVQNRPSQRIMAKCGFQPQNTEESRLNFRLTRSQWQKKC